MRIDFERTYVGALTAIAALSAMAGLGSYGVLTARGPLAGRMLLAVAVCGATMLWLVPGIISDIRVYFSEEGIHRPYPLRGGELFIRWTEVDRVTRSSITPTLHAGAKQISIQLLTFRDPPAVWKLLQERLPHLSAPKS